MLACFVVLFLLVELTVMLCSIFCELYKLVVRTSAMFGYQSQATYDGFCVKLFAGPLTPVPSSVDHVPIGEPISHVLFSVMLRLLL